MRGVQGIQRHTEAYRGVQGHTEAYRGVQGHTEPTGKQTRQARHTEAHRGVQGHTGKAYRGKQTRQARQGQCKTGVLKLNQAVVAQPVAMIEAQQQWQELYDRGAAQQQQWQELYDRGVARQLFCRQPSCSTSNGLCMEVVSGPRHHLAQAPSCPPGAAAGSKGFHGTLSRQGTSANKQGIRTQGIRRHTESYRVTQARRTEAYRVTQARRTQASRQGKRGIRRRTGEYRGT